MNLHEFNAHRHTVATASGSASYVDIGPRDGRTILFVHGLGTNAYLWRNVIAGLAAEYRCVALDLPLHGDTPAGADRDFSLVGLTQFVEDFRTALDLTNIDLVGNDTGGAICQVFAATHPERVMTLTLTDCDTHENLPPEGFKPVVEAAGKGDLAPTAPDLVAVPEQARKQLFAGTYQSDDLPDDETVQIYLRPVMGTVELAREFERLLVALDAEDLMAIEPQLRTLTAPTLIVWGTDDPLFDLKWAYWLRGTIPGATKVVEVSGGRLFFPEERPEELIEPLRDFLG
ncbi:alpha/beta hydrolase [Nocardia colli]|uniref:Alpha/beta hydrolase n=1 Tax=Nocardia colli TaxID=2545717 RepID=A0A5N0DXE4_9NOCA|nr:alpha/beta hydrolase [Nocardia colli]KAA8880624.1 alpha/beta hydrolase [Nocardia colli]